LNQVVNYGASTSSGSRYHNDGNTNTGPVSVVGSNQQPNVNLGPGDVDSNTNSNEPINYRVLSYTETDYPRFQTTAGRMNIRFNDYGPNDHVVAWIDRCLDELINNLTRTIPHSDRVGLTFSDTRDVNKPFHVSPRFPHMLDKNVILEQLNAIYQSNEEFLMNDLLTIDTLHIRAPNGGYRSINNKPLCDYLKSHFKSFININREDNKCFAYAMIAAKINHECANDKARLLKFRRSIKARKFEWLDREYNDFWVPLGVDVSQGATLDHVKMAQEALKDQFRIHVFLDRSGRELAFTPTGCTSSGVVDVHLLLEQNHYIFIKPKSLMTVFGFGYYCAYCRKGYYHKDAHYKCKYTCPGCFESLHCTGVDVVCNLCNRNFKGMECKNKHIANNVCENVKRCTDCGVTVKPKRGLHVCGYRYCIKCRTYRPTPHGCMVAQMKPKNTRQNDEVLYVYYDFESRMDENVEGSSTKFKHIPNLCVAFQRCKDCPDIKDQIEIENECSNCGVRKHIFERENTLNDFFGYLMNIDGKFNSVIVIAHNARSYDGHFMLQAILENRNDDPSIIVNGSQIIAMSFTRYRFIDSLNFLNCSLSKLPAMFKLDGAMKGFYPFLYNTKENENAPPGPIPDKKFYMPEGMTAKGRVAFDAWYETQKDVVFNNFFELKKYCENDVFILMQACEKFRDLFFKTTGYEIFRNSATMASACMAVYRTNFMKKDSISLIPKNGYRMMNKQSKVAIRWLYWLQYGERKIKNLIHAGDDSEKRLPGGFFVDGFEPEGGANKKGKVYEFLGDYFHQCPKHFGRKTLTPTDVNAASFDVQDHLSFRLEDTMARLDILRKTYEVEYIWECDFRKLEKTPEYKEFEKQYGYLWQVEKLDPRDAMLGGRVNNLKLYKKADIASGEKIYYNDITSLYPYICRDGVYPIGHPKQRFHGENMKYFDINTMHGVVQLKIQPPEDLYIPVLPQKLHEKLMFHTCQKCADDKVENFCTHTNAERSITGTYVIEEVRLALKMGYKIEKIYEAWVYDTEQKGAVGGGGLFTEYVNMFLKIKQEASGWPSWVTHRDDGVERSADERQQKQCEYITKYREREGIELETEKIEKNPGLRTIAKNCLNGLWGKFGERENKRRTAIVSDRAELWEYLTDSKYEVQAVIPINDQKMLVHYQYEDSDAPTLDFANVIIAAFTTAQARIELYKYLDHFGPRTLYHDTDCVIYTAKPGESVVEISDYLGGMTDELIDYGPGSYATEFVSGGPKNYALKVFSSAKKDFAYICKVKGITLNAENMEKINFDSIKTMITDRDSCRSISVVDNHKISRDITKGIWSSVQKKTYKTVLSKRWRENPNDYDTLPFGMKRRRVE
jgi:DNA polymerase type B, organellar and viral